MFGSSGRCGVVVTPEAHKYEVTERRRALRQQFPIVLCHRLMCPNGDRLFRRRLGPEASEN